MLWKRSRWTSDYSLVNMQSPRILGPIKEYLLRRGNEEVETSLILILPELKEGSYLPCLSIRITEIQTDEKEGKFSG